jgi:CheY-like chemotaxis protein
MATARTDIERRSARVLVIDDVQEQADGLVLDLQEQNAGGCYKTCPITDQLQQVREFSPDSIVLDLYQGPAVDQDPQGMATYNEIWQHSFVPILVFTAGAPDPVLSSAKGHPLVGYVSKNQAGANRAAAEWAIRMAPIGQGLKEMRSLLVENVSQATQASIQFTLPLVWDTSKDNDVNLGVIRDAARRRLASVVRYHIGDQRGHIQAWEQYVVPAAAPQLRMGDIIRRATGSINDIDAYRVILTPSCDMVPSRLRVNQVLAAKCVSVSEYTSKLSLSQNAAKAIEKLKSHLSEPQFAGLVPMPGLREVLPIMAISLRNTVLLDVAALPMRGVESSDKEFVLVASLDSPYREWLAWAHLQIACRPGLPVRDDDAWAREIVESLPHDEPGNVAEGG